MFNQISVPCKWVGPILINGSYVSGEVKVPLATYEIPLWPSVNRGAKITRLAGGINTVIWRNNMARSFSLKANSAREAVAVSQKISCDLAKSSVAKSSRFAEFLKLERRVVGNIIYFRLEIDPKDASGHNMVTKASDQLIKDLLAAHPELSYSSISANFCTDKKVSAVNSILGRGKSVIAEMLIPEEILKKNLNTTAEQLCELNYQKNYVGSTLAGSLNSANAHFANMLLAIYLATGQDAANIVEGSQGMVMTEARNKDLNISINLPNIIVGTIGNGKHLDFVKDNLNAMGLNDPLVGVNSKKLAEIVAATVFCGELSLLAAITNQGELMRSHIAFERSV